MGNLGNTYRSLGKYADAEEHQIKVLDARNRLFREDHPDTVLAMDILVNIYGNLGKYADAEELQLKVLDMSNRLLGED